MLISKYNRFYFIFALHLIIAFGFYFENINANYSSLSSDLKNIIPVAQKFDNPELFKKDLFVNDINNVKYYTPFFVQPLRFIAKFTSYDYVQAVNVLNAICHLLFGVLWFYLIFRFIPDFWIALIVSFLMRGIVWLPGFEIWGIADLWAMMPRTLYITLFPIPFLVLNSRINTVVWSAFLMGLIFNFHPITGLGGILLYLAFLVLVIVIYKKRNLVSAKAVLALLFALALGMFPFVLTYFGKTSSTVNYNMDAFQEAFNARIPLFFTQPLIYLKQWIHFKTLFYVIPILLYFLISLKNKKELKRAKLIIALTLVLIVLPSISVYVEHFINSALGLNLRLSFQLIRAQKVAIIPSFFAMAYLLQYYQVKFKKKYVVPSLFSGYIIVLVVCKLALFNGIPFVGDDISRLILPNSLSFGNLKSNSALAIDNMAAYILNHTDETALIYGGHHYRGACRRSVILDSKGASMLIEGNPARFIQWKANQKRISNAGSIEEIIVVLKLLEVDYIVSKNKDYNKVLTPIHTEDNISLYKL